jgi:hypothetical protein
MDWLMLKFIWDPYVHLYWDADMSPKETLGTKQGQLSKSLGM